MTALNDHLVVQLMEALRMHDASGHHDYMTSFWPHLKIVEVRDGTADHYRAPSMVFEYTVQPEHCNGMGNLHGGATATLFDFCTSLAVLLAEDKAAKDSGSAFAPDDLESVARLFLRSGVSRTLNVTYVRPAPCGTRVLIDCEALHAGRRLSSLRGLLRRASDGAVLASCEHGKALSKI